MTASTSPDHQNATAAIETTLGTSARLPEPLTSFVGRKDEVDELLALLNHPDTRLVTLTGPGEVGKTRLAIKLAKAIALTDAMEVAFIPLAPVRDPSHLAATIGATFGVNDRGAQ